MLGYSVIIVESAPRAAVVTFLSAETSRMPYITHDERTRPDAVTGAIDAALRCWTSSCVY